MLFSDLKALVYGMGRAAGIRVKPRHHRGSEAENTVALAKDVLVAPKVPPDVEWGPQAVVTASALSAALSGTTIEVTQVAACLEAYVAARLHNPRAIIEH